MSEWIDSNDTLAAWMTARSAPAPIALDTEFMRTNTFAPKLALVQLNIGADTALLDSPALGTHAALAERLTAPDSLCIMHSASEDLEALTGVVPGGPHALFDTQIAAAMVGLGMAMSYQKLVSSLLGVDLPKAETRSDWLQRPLSPAQIEYAAQDVAHLPELYTLLAVKLHDLGRSDWLAEDCARLIERVCHAPVDTQPQRALRGAADWPHEQQALLRRLLRWRDASARTLDKPRPWLLDDAHAMSLAAQPPQTGAELFERSKGLRALRGEQRTELLAIIHAPATEDDARTAPIPPQLTTQQKRASTAMKEAILAIAQQLGLPEGLLCSRRHLETLLTDRVWPAALEGWRKSLLHDPLMALLPDA